MRASKWMAQEYARAIARVVVAQLASSAGYERLQVVNAILVHILSAVVYKCLSSRRVKLMCLTWMLPTCTPARAILSVLTCGDAGKRT